jgi:hypothetical protein
MEGNAMRTRQARRMVVVLAAVAMLALGGSVVLAAIPSGGGMIYACYSKSTGAMRVVNYPAVRCKSSERLLSWTQIGPKAPPLSSIGIQTVGGLNSTFDINSDPNNAILRVFVETGSTSPRSLATLNEAGGGLAPAPRVSELWLGTRTVTFADKTTHSGLMLTLVLAAEAPPDVHYDVNVYQEGAKSYGTPIKCDMPGCNE